MFKQEAKLKSTSLVVVFLLTILAQPAISLACGASFVPASNGQNWAYGNDSAEQSFVNYKNGTEQLVISRSFDNGSRDTAWVIPVPSKANEIKTDVLTETPTLRGSQISAEAAASAENVRDNLLTTQIYPWLIRTLSADTDSTFEGLAVSGRGNIQSSTLDLGAIPKHITSVVVHDHLEKNGMTVEVLSADSSDDLYKYLNDKGIHTQKDSIDVLKSYVGKGFSFVASWVQPTQNFGERKGLSMTFPAEQMYYPLKPGSIYSGKGLPETINVMGYVSPKLYKNIEGFTNVRYYYSDEAFEENDFFSTNNEHKFTEITVDARPRRLTEDLYISQHAPLQITLAQTVVSMPVAVGLAQMLFIAVFSAAFASVLIARFTRNNPRYIVLGAMTLLGILGAAIGTIFFLKEKIYINLLYVLFYTGIFVGMTFLVGFVLRTLIESMTH